MAHGVPDLPVCVSEDKSHCFVVIYSLICKHLLTPRLAWQDPLI